MYMDHVVQGGWETLEGRAGQAVKGGGTLDPILDPPLSLI